MNDARLRAAIGGIEDPELPQLTLRDLGMVHEVTIDGDEVAVTLLPTFLGCPAKDEIRDRVVAVIGAARRRARVTFALDPAWSTDRITERARRRLRRAGIAAPPPIDGRSAVALLDLPPCCPRCGSRRTRRLADFGGTPCALPHVCRSCHEPFTSLRAT